MFQGCFRFQGSGSGVFRVFRGSGFNSCNRAFVARVTFPYSFSLLQVNPLQLIPDGSGSSILIIDYFSAFSVLSVVEEIRVHP